MTTTICDRAERVAVYQLFARLWAEEAGQLLVQLKTEPLATAWRLLGGSVSEHESDDAQASLDEDYCRLFVGPKGHLPPIQSVWMNGELDTGVTASLREFDTVIGFEQPWDFSIIPDHLGNELWAMSQILRKSAGLPAEDQTVADDLAGEFFKGHLN
jgi:TorA maturation chaperone TorD